MDLIDVMHTTFAARDFTDDPVPDSVLHRILDHARFAPSGGNRQGWHVIVVRDAAKRSALMPLVEAPLRRYLAEAKAGGNPWSTIAPVHLEAADVERTAVPPGAVERLVFAPALLLVSVDLAVVAALDRHQPRIGVVSGASIYPFVWNILLAARNEGLGGTLTTFIAAKEAEAKTLFGIPENHALAAMIPIGKPVTQLTRLKRNPVTAFATLDTFDGKPLQSG